MEYFGSDDLSLSNTNDYYQGLPASDDSVVRLPSTPQNYRTPSPIDPPPVDLPNSFSTPTRRICDMLLSPLPFELDPATEGLLEELLAASSPQLPPPTPFPIPPSPVDPLDDPFNSKPLAKWPPPKEPDPFEFSSTKADKTDIVEYSSSPVSIGTWSTNSSSSPSPSPPSSPGYCNPAYSQRTKRQDPSRLLPRSNKTPRPRMAGSPTPWVRPQDSEFARYYEEVVDTEYQYYMQERRKNLKAELRTWISEKNRVPAASEWVVGYVGSDGRVKEVEDPRKVSSSGYRDKIARVRSGKK